jgi:hypothetical protein
MEIEARVASVEQTQTRNGNTRYVVRDDEGREFTTFRPGIGEQAAGLEGRRARIEFHEEERNGFHNVYLDSISEAPEPQAASGTDPDEVAWSTAVEAAPWVLGRASRSAKWHPRSSTRSLSRSSGSSPTTFARAVNATNDLALVWRGLEGGI